jgi:ferrous iron transport protein A
MRQTGTLTDLQQGRRGVVVSIDSYKQAKDSMRRRLQDLGLVEGAEVVCLGKSPLGDPTAFGIRGAVIALRAEDSSRVRVQWD